MAKISETIDKGRWYDDRTFENLQKTENALGQNGMILDAELGGLALSVEGRFNGLYLVALTEDESFDSYVEQINESELPYEIALTAMAYTPGAVAEAWNYENTPNVTKDQVLEGAKQMKEALTKTARDIYPESEKFSPYPVLDTSVKFWLETSRVLDRRAFYSEKNQDEEFNCPPIPIDIFARMDETITFRDLIETPELLDDDSIADMAFDGFVEPDVIRNVVKAGLEEAKSQQIIYAQTMDKNLKDDITGTFNKWMEDVPGVTLDYRNGIVVEGAPIPMTPHIKDTALIKFPPIAEDNFDPMASATQFINFADYADSVIITRDIEREGRLDHSKAAFIADCIVNRLDRAADEIATRYGFGRDRAAKTLDAPVSAWLKNADPKQYETLVKSDIVKDPRHSFGVAGLTNLRLRDIALNNKENLVTATLELMDDYTKASLLKAIEIKNEKEMYQVQAHLSEMKGQHLSNDNKGVSSQSQNFDFS